MIDSSRVSPWTGLARRLWGYAGVSAVGSLLSYLLLTVCAGWLGIPLVAANVVAEVGGAVLGFALNRRYVWQVTEGVDLRAEVIPFALVSCLDLILTSAAVESANMMMTGMGLGPATRSLVAVFASAAAGTVCWVWQFALFERRKTQGPVESGRRNKALRTAVTSLTPVTAS